VKYKESHKIKNTYSDRTAQLDRNRFSRLFAAAANAEKAKELDGDDANPDKESK
jgi:hypothetical protein